MKRNQIKKNWARPSDRGVGKFFVLDLGYFNKIHIDCNRNIGLNILGPSIKRLLKKEKFFLGFLFLSLGSIPTIQFKSLSFISCRSCILPISVSESLLPGLPLCMEKLELRGSFCSYGSLRSWIYYILVLQWAPQEKGFTCSKNGRSPCQ